MKPATPFDGLDRMPFEFGLLEGRLLQDVPAEDLFYLWVFDDLFDEVESRTVEGNRERLALYIINNFHELANEFPDFAAFLPV